MTDHERRIANNLRAGVEILEKQLNWQRKVPEAGIHGYWYTPKDQSVETLLQNIRDGFDVRITPQHYMPRYPAILLNHANVTPEDVGVVHRLVVAGEFIPEGVTLEMWTTNNAQWRTIKGWPADMTGASLRVLRTVPWPNDPRLDRPIDGGELHNPEGLTADEVGAGWRLLTKYEHANMQLSADLWYRANREWYRSTGIRSDSVSYRISADIPWVSPCGEPWKVEDYLPGTYVSTWALTFASPHPAHFSPLCVDHTVDGVFLSYLDGNTIVQFSLEDFPRTHIVLLPGATKWVKPYKMRA